MKLTMEMDEARLVLNTLRGREKNMRSDSRHDDDRRKLRSTIYRLEAEVRVAEEDRR